jgi:hypothetical protein
VPTATTPNINQGKTMSESNNIRVTIGAASAPSTDGTTANIDTHTGAGPGELTVTSVEYLNVADSQQISHSADVQQFPTADEFNNEIAAHNRFIADATAKLAEQNFDPRTGQPKGHRYEGDDRRHLEMQLQNRKAALEYTHHTLGRAHAAAQERADRHAQARADGQPAGESQLVQAHRREVLIAETAADIGGNGQPIGRIEATRLVDEALNKERVAARVRASR